jgi:hypothetical protein
MKNDIQTNVSSQMTVEEISQKYNGGKKIIDFVGNKKIYFGISIAIILIGDNEATVKRVIKKEHLLILEAANPNVENMYFTEKDVEELPVRIIGKVLYNKIRF